MVKCDKCWHEGMGCNTGEMQQDGYLNCMCGTAAMRHKFNQAITAWVKDVPMTQGDLLWAVCQRAVEQERAKARVALFRIDDLFANGHSEAYELMSAELRRIA